jgi:probable phosphoglycerate mutase
MPDSHSLTLYVLRHGECEHNLERRIAAQNDSPLTDKGYEQARANGVLLRELAGSVEKLQFYASPLHRTCATMEIAREAAGLSPRGYFADRRLMEIDCGKHTWLTWPEIEARAAQDPLWATDRWDYVHPGGESLSMLFRRVGDFLDELKQDAVLVVHAGTMRMIRAHVLALSQDATMAYHTPNAGILRLSQGTEAYFGG